MGPLDCLKGLRDARFEERHAWDTRNTEMLQIRSPEGALKIGETLH